MPIFRDHEGEEGTFGPSMSAAMSLHRHREVPEESEKDDKDGKTSKKGEHLKKAKHHLDKALEEHEGMEHAQDEDMNGGAGLSALMGGEDEE